MNLECFGLDCMLRHRRNHLVRELWRASASLRERDGPSPSVNALDTKMKSTLNSILKRLDIDELELLLEAVKSKGRSHAECIQLTLRLPATCPDTAQPPATTHSAGSTDVSHAVCKAWRWPTLQPSDSLTLLPNCQIPGDTDGQSRCCINPFHWFKVSDVISDLKPCKWQSAVDEVYLHRKVDADNNTEFTYNDSTEVEWRKDSWCHIAYWELSTRIGQLFPVTPSAIDIFQDVAHGCGVSLATLHYTHPAKSTSMASVRSKIGAGVTLSNEGDLIRVYNKSERDVFVTSYCLNIDKRGDELWRVCKVLPGHSIVIYDYNLLRARPEQSDPLTEGLSNPHSILLSFVKGWSGSYSRQSVLSCECWLEILINKRKFEGR